MKKRVYISVTNDIACDQRMQKTSASLIKQGYEVKIIGRYKKDSPSLSTYSFESKRFHLIFNRGKFFYIEYQLRLFLYLLFQRIDILCAVDLDTIIPNVLIGKLKNIPVIYDAHEYFTEVPELKDRPLEKKIWKSIENICLPLCSKIYTVSPNLALMFEKEYNKSCEVIYNFPNVRSVNKLIGIEKENIMLYQGDLNEGRGLDIAICSMKSLIDYELWIAGDGYDRDNLEQLTLSLGLVDRVKFMGRILPKDLVTITQKAKFGLNLLENKGLNYYYSLANKHFDYIQSGVPPISMSFPEYREIDKIYQCAILVEDLTSESFLKSLAPYLKDQNKYIELVKKCDIARSFLNWEVQEEKLSSIYNYA